MKNQRLLMIVSMLFALNIRNVNCQTPTPWYEGGNSISNPSNQYIGTNNTQPVDIYTDGVRKIRVAPSGNVGINKDNPLNKLEINSGVSGETGLRFYQVTCGSTVSQYNCSGKVLTLDHQGNVILAQNTPTLDACGSTGSASDNFLTKWADGAARVICQSQVFDNGTNVQITRGSGTTPINPLFLVSNTVGTAGTFSAKNTTSASDNIGVKGTAAGSSMQNYGGRFEASATSGKINYGVCGSAGSTPNLDISGNIGGLFEANSEGVNVGVYGIAEQGGFAGVMVGTGIITDRWIEFSDAMFKDSIEDLSGSESLTLLSELQPKSFVMRSDSFPHLNFSEGRQYGLIAQQVDSVLAIVREGTFPEITDTNGNVLMDTLEFLGLDYKDIIPFLIAGINQLNSETVTTCSTETITNRIPKWSTTSKTLCSTNIIAEGGHVGVNETSDATFTVITDSDTAAIYAGGATMGGMFAGQNGGIFATASGSGDDDFHAGVLGFCENSPNMNIGVIGGAYAHADSINVGVIGTADSAELFNAGVGGLAGEEGVGEAVNFGVAGFARNSTDESRAGFFQVAGCETCDTSLNIAVHGQVDNDDTVSTLYAGYFEGDLHYTGDLIPPSDRALKKNIEDVDNALEKLMQLQPREYEYKADEYDNMTLSRGKHYGLIAQELEATFPELVREVIHPAQWERTGKGLQGRIVSPQMPYKGINYIELIPWLLQGMKEQQALIDSLNSRLTTLEGKDDVQFRLTDEGNADDEAVNQMTVDLSSLQVVVLEQNVPNPFAEQTSISYFIPEDADAARIMFFDLSGRILKIVDVQKGYGIMTVFTPSLSNGTYSYSLLIDGKVVETKKMMKAW